MLLVIYFIIFPVSNARSLIPGASFSARLPMRDDPNIPSVVHYDLADYEATAHGDKRGERILYLVPLRDAVPHMQMFFGHMENLTYPHNLIDLAFLVSDSKDDTLNVLHQ